MADPLALVLLALIFVCGLCVGGIVCFVVAMRRKMAQEVPEFTGGFEDDIPPVRTRIWSDSIDARGRK